MQGPLGSFRAVVQGLTVQHTFDWCLTGFGPGASPPMQPILGHSALKLCEIGALRYHVGR